MVLLGQDRDKRGETTVYRDCCLSALGIEKCYRDSQQSKILNEEFQRSLVCIQSRAMIEHLGIQNPSPGVYVVAGCN